MEQLEQLLPPELLRTTVVIHADPMTFLGDREWKGVKAGVW